MGLKPSNLPPKQEICLKHSPTRLSFISDGNLKMAKSLQLYTAGHPIRSQPNSQRDSPLCGFRTVPLPCFLNLPSGVTLNKDTSLPKMGNKHPDPPRLPLASLSSHLRVLPQTIIGPGLLTCGFSLTPSCARCSTLASSSSSITWELFRDFGLPRRTGPEPVSLQDPRVIRVHRKVRDDPHCIGASFNGDCREINTTHQV